MRWKAKSLRRLHGWPLLVLAGAGAAAIFRMLPRSSFRGQVVLITGGSRGLGLLLLREVLQRYGRIDLLINNAGLIQVAPLAQMSLADFERRILAACARGQSFLTLGLPAKLRRLFHGLLPGTTARLLALANSLLPAPGGAGPSSEAEPGWQHRSWLSRSFLTSLGNTAARENRELPWAPPERGPTRH